MYETFVAMAAIFATWVVWGAAFVSLGAAILPVGGDRGAERFGADVWFAWFWAGWCGVVLALQVWHLWMPVDARAAGVVLGLAAVAAIWRRRAMLSATRATSGRGGVSRGVLLAGFAIAILWSNLATGEIRITDTGLYHMQAARWNAAYAIVPGLGNLHGRLAYNNASLLYAALVDVGPWSHGGHHVANGLLTLGVVLPLAASVPRAFVLPGQNALDVADWARHVARSLLIAPTVLHAYKHATSLSPDLAAALLGTVLAILLIDMCVDRVRGRSITIRQVAFVALVAATSVTVKLSMIATGATAAVVALFLASGNLTRSRRARCALGGGEEALSGRRGLGIAREASGSPLGLTYLSGGDDKAVSGRRGLGLVSVGSRSPLGLTYFWCLLGPWLLVGGLFAFAVGTWGARGVVLSGCVAYPSQAIAFDVEWRVSPEWAEEDRRTIVAWARGPDRPPDEVLGNFRWVGPWFLRESSDVFGVALPVAVLVGCGAMRARYRRGDTGDEGEGAIRLWPAAVPFVAALAFMFFTAPDISRFGGASIWILAVVATAALLVRLREVARDEAFLAFARGVAILGIALATVAAVKVARYVRVSGGLAATPQAELRVVRTPFGLKLFVPTESDRAWDAPLPSTPYPKPQLTARDEGDLGAGFVHQEGGPPWEMQSE